MKKLITGIAAVVLLAMIYVLLQQFSWVEITNFFALFVIAGLSLGVLVGLFTVDKALLQQEKKLKAEVKKANQRVEQAEQIARQKVEEELSTARKELEKQQIELKRQQQRLVERMQELDHDVIEAKQKASEQVALAKRLSKQADDKKTKAMAYNERKARRLEKLKTKIESGQEKITQQDVLKAIR